MQRDGIKNKTSMIDECIQFLERDTRALQIITYGITGLGLMTAMYRMRPFAKFTKPSDVPSRFIKLKIPLEGEVVRIEPNHGALIMVDHRPLIRLPTFGKPRQLPLKVAGVDVTNHGISWLQTVACGKKIVFVPLARKSDYVDCTIGLRESKETTISIGEELVRLGFGTVGNLETDPRNEQHIKAYKAALNAAEKRAKLERNGYWHFAISPTYLWKLRSLVHNKISHVLPAGISRQMSI